jgi:flagellar motor switch protein FliM
MMMGNERVLLLTVEVIIQGVTGTLSIIIPFNMLKPIINVLNPHIWIAGRKEQQQDPVARQAAMQAMMKAVIPVKVILGSADLPMRDLMDLSVGDVIGLDNKIEDPMVVQVANKKQFYARVGKSRKHLGIQICGVYRENDGVQPGY